MGRDKSPRHGGAGTRQGPHRALGVRRSPLGARHSARAARRPAFTLIETALATVIIGVGVVAIVEAHNAFLRTNTWSSQAATAAFLGNEVRELTRRLPRHDPVTGLTIGEKEGGGTVLLGWGIDLGEVVVADLDDLDDFAGLRFGNGGDFPGPIDGFGNVIPQTLADGTVLLDDNGNVLPLQGWSQTVVVEKVLPTNFAAVVANDFEIPAGGAQPARRVDQFPLRVTVIVEYQGPFDASPMEMTRVTWIAP